ncbi:SDR family NAD(P)-dependent oxidoreductase [Acinetobacter radioresistens]|uniref:SDR family NAD(P)-dependent oxidoreductase n=1 Tax=Acinetobacter radioresistens TaxID=40216 RepID=UPI0009465313|nr:SDR family oxidoreductase [Acinetobacter radioresistens]
MNGSELYNFTNKVVLITGAASGLGEALAQKFGLLGAKLVVGDTNEGKLLDLVEKLKLKGVDIVGMKSDVSSEEDQQRLVEKAIISWNRLDIAINNAGMSPKMKSLVDTTEGDFDKTISVNAKGVFLGLKYQTKAMIEHQVQGTILNVSSVAGISGAPFLSAYSAAKHAVIGLTKTAALENAKYGIKINAICPFYTLTPMVMDSNLNDKIDALAQVNPMKRLAKIEEVVDVMVMLCSTANSYMTGQSITIDGGLTAQ